ncbi:hypothetical protein SMACR_02195 [Sordaria macrospora]|uniref:Uncharacterized protein n=1 Tax=Sordaria macrospora TaxID=5147 RepID=A0A8S8ZPX0_SORMA|nr:hypothetical protein SMACR_02195 [Sordaria macrospora]
MPRAPPKQLELPSPTFSSSHTQHQHHLSHSPHLTQQHFIRPLFLHSLRISKKPKWAKIRKHPAPAARAAAERTRARTLEARTLARPPRALSRLMFGIFCARNMARRRKPWPRSVTERISVLLPGSIVRIRLGLAEVWVGSKRVLWTPSSKGSRLLWRRALPESPRLVRPRRPLATTSSW